MVVVFPVILDLALLNAQTILKYNSSQHKNQPRQEFIRNFSFQLFLPHIKKHKQISSPQKNAKDALDSALNYMEVDQKD